MEATRVQPRCEDRYIKIDFKDVKRLCFNYDICYLINNSHCSRNDLEFFESTRVQISLTMRGSLLLEEKF